MEGESFTLWWWGGMMVVHLGNIGYFVMNRNGANLEFRRKLMIGLVVFTAALQAMLPCFTSFEASKSIRVYLWDIPNLYSNIYFELLLATIGRMALKYSRSLLHGYRIDIDAIFR